MVRYAKIIGKFIVNRNTTKFQHIFSSIAGRKWSNIGHMNLWNCRRCYSTAEKAASTQQFQTQIISKLFPQTSLDINNEADRRRMERETEEDAAEIERAWKRMKFWFAFFGVGTVCSLIWAIYAFGRPQLDANGMVIEDEFMSSPLVLQYVQRIWKSMYHLQKFIQEPSSPKLLPDPLKPPYIQPAYTLVVEMKDLLIHPDWTYETGWRFKKRPGVDLFLRECSKYFEVVVFTAEQGITVFPLLDALDPNGYIMYRLVRDSTHFVDGHHVKNLEHLNRDLKRVVVIDWNKQSTMLHPNNSFNIPRWEGNDDDTTLFDLVSFLTVLANSGVEDVRNVLQYYSQYDDPIQKFRENQRIVMEQMQEKEKEMQAKTKPMLQQWTRSFMRRQ